MCMIYIYILTQIWYNCWILWTRPRIYGSPPKKSPRIKKLLMVVETMSLVVNKLFTLGYLWDIVSTGVFFFVSRTWHDCALFFWLSRCQEFTADVFYQLYMSLGVPSIAWPDLRNDSWIVFLQWKITSQPANILFWGTTKDWPWS